MANALGTETPPAPDNPAMGNALMNPPQGGPQQGAPAQPQQPSPPTHAQTVAALRHFDAVKRQMEVILADPALGKSNVKSKIIDRVTQLVAERFMKPAEAVDTLSKVPSEPLMQMKWAKAQLSQAKQAENAILDHYGMGSPHFGSVGEHFSANPAPDHDDHFDHRAALMANYGKANA